jgi:polyadenylate-binding protein
MNTGPKKAFPTLFMSGLAEEVDEATIMRHFENYAKNIKLRHVEVRRDFQTFKSKCAATIECNNVEDAEKALLAVNFTELSGKEILLTYYRPGGIRDKITANIFVKNLPEDCKSRDLFAIFSAEGKIFSCKVKYNTVGKSKGYGYVCFDKKEDADKVLASKTPRQFNGTAIEVAPFKPRDTRESSIYKYNNLYVKCFPKKYTNEDLKKLFSQFGNIKSAVVIKESETAPENKGFGFVCFEKFEDAKMAEEKMKNMKIEGVNLFVCRALAKEEHEKQKRENRFKTFKDCNLYVKELSDDITDEKLKAAFVQFGSVISVRVMLGNKVNPASNQVERKSRNFGFVCFSKREEAEAAIQAAKTKEIMGRMLYVAIAEKKEDRIARSFQAQFNPFFQPYPGGMYNMPPPAFWQHPYGGRPHMPRQVFSLHSLTINRITKVEDSREDITIESSPCILKDISLLGTILQWGQCLCLWE